jgi:hypothetical protein
MSLSNVGNNCLATLQPTRNQQRLPAPIIPSIPPQAGARGTLKEKAIGNAKKVQAASAKKGGPVGSLFQNPDDDKLQDLWLPTSKTGE